MPVDEIAPRRSIAARAAAIVLSPRSEWARIAAEDRPSGEVLNRYVLPLSLIWPVCASIGALTFGHFGYGAGPLSDPTPVTPVSVLGSAIIVFLGTLFSLLALAMFASIVARHHGGTHGGDRAFALIGYGSTPVLLAGVVALVPSLAWLGLVALYGVRLLYLGAAPMLGVPREKVLRFTVVVVAAATLLNVIVVMMTRLNDALITGMGMA
ncbi:Yip1 family protein [Novosphingobium bradum]|uniref:Yip1 family protein n=1 Tax=Novosphingobium bradum TaxID=1737444 RepID=A0ABV7IPK8_9SPHN